MGEETPDRTVRMTVGEYSLLVAVVNQVQGWLSGMEKYALIHGRLIIPVHELQRANRTLVEVGIRNGVLTREEVER